MTDCGLECDSNQCILDCWAKFLDAHRDCPCEVIQNRFQFDPKWPQVNWNGLLYDLTLRQIVQTDVHVIAMNAMESVQDLKLKDQSQLEKAKRLKVFQGSASWSIQGPIIPWHIMSGGLWSLVKDYGMNFDFSFDFKPNSVPDGYGHVLQVGQTEVSSYEDSMAFLFYNKNDYFQGRI